MTPADLPIAISSRMRVDADTGCWLWIGYTHRGYAQIHSRRGHRVTYELFVGAIPEGLEIDHLCANVGCINPAHLEPVTHDENMRRRAERQTHCKRGHEFNESNTYRYPGKDGSVRRCCRACNRMAVAQSKLRRAS